MQLDVSFVGLLEFSYEDGEILAQGYIPTPGKNWRHFYRNHTDQKIPIKSYPYSSSSKQFTSKNLCLKALYLREKTVMSKQILENFSK